MSEDFKLIIITADKDIKGECDTISKLFENGLQLLHLRKSLNTIEDTRNLLNTIPTTFHSRIVLHNHYELLNDFNMKGAHLSESRRREGYSNNLKNIISTSFHRLDTLLETQYNFEYAFLSPVFQSISKQGYKPSVEPEILKDFFKSKKEQIKFPIIALGGISDKNILQAKTIGFSGVACIGYIWESPNPIEQFNKLQNILRPNYRSNRKYFSCPF